MEFVPQEVTDHVLLLAELHAAFAPNITALASEAVETGAPINRPVWWVQPDDEVALAIEDGERVVNSP